MRFTGSKAVGVAFVGLAVATDFLDHGKLLSGVEDPAWFEANVPILDVPDDKLSQVYYYRWQSYREHLFYSCAQFGYILTEFLVPVSYGAPYGGVNAAAGHHINEGKWLRNQRYTKDYVNYWLNGPGQWSKPQNEGVNKDTTDWAHEYSFWSASSVYRQYLVQGDKDFVTGHLDNLVAVYRGYDNHFDDTLGLYWQYPVWDATEYTAASYETDPSDPYHGGVGYRPTINAYQYGDAKAIAAIATLAGNSAIADEYKKRADALAAAMTTHLWDKDNSFFKHMARDNNPSNTLLGTREIMGYLPWQFGVPLDTSYSAAFTQLTDSDGFKSDYGPTSAERRSTWFMHEAASGCCRWDGPSWPYATAQTLTAAENLLNDYDSQDNFSSNDYYTLLSQYVNTQFKNGKPYIAEAHDPDQDNWMYDSQNHSEDYNHSTFVENVIAGLIGLRIQPDNSLVVNPLAPSTWTNFGLENVAYHGHNVTVIYDKDGSHYSQGKGLTVFVDGAKTGNRADLGSLTVNVGDVKGQTADAQINVAANPWKFDQGTTPTASFTSASGGDTVWGPVDGTIFRRGIPENTRWTTYGTSNQNDWFNLDFHQTQSISDVRLYFYEDGDGVRLPASYDLQYADGNGNFQSIPNQDRVGDNSLNAEIRITFPAVTTSQLRLVAPNAGGGNGWGLSEFQAWVPAVYWLQNVNSGKLMGVNNVSKNSGAPVQQYENNNSADHLWQIVPAPGGWYKFLNQNSGKVLAVKEGSTSDSAQLEQEDDNGADSQLWRVEDKGKGQFIIKNKKSKLVAGVDQESKDNGANVVQFDDSGTNDHLWEFLPVAGK